MGIWQSKDKKDQEEKESAAKRQAELEKITIESNARCKLVEIEWSARKEMTLAQVKLEDKKADLDHQYKIEQTTNEKIKNTLHVQTQSEVMAKIIERGFSPDDFCMAAGTSYFTLKDELQNEEMEILKKTMITSMEHKTKANRYRHKDESDTECGGDGNTADNLFVTRSCA